MGGHAAGEVASEIAVDVICDRAHGTPPMPRRSARPWKRRTSPSSAPPREGVGRAGMGCTCTAAMLEKDKLVIAQVGDSRAYLLHKGQMQQLTTRPLACGRPYRGRANYRGRGPGAPPALGHHPRFGQRPAHPAGSLRNHRGSRRPSASVLRWPFHDVGRRPDRQDPRQPQRAPALRGSAGERGRGPGRLRQRHRHRRGRHGSGRAAPPQADAQEPRDGHHAGAFAGGHHRRVRLWVQLSGVQRRLSGGSGWESRRVPGRSRRHLRILVQSPRPA